MLGNEDIHRQLGELKGQVSLLEKLVVKLVTEDILSVKIQSRDAEAVATRALEIVQAFVNEASQGGGEDFEEGQESPHRFSVRGGMVGLAKAEKADG